MTENYSIVNNKRKMITIYGIQNCDSCKKAIKQLSGRAEFHDVRKYALSDEILESFVETFGDKIINTRSKTWKTLSVSDKILQPVELLKRFPTLMKRPVIQCSKSMRKTLGWDERVQRHYI